MMLLVQFLVACLNTVPLILPDCWGSSVSQAREHFHPWPWAQDLRGAIVCQEVALFTWLAYKSRMGYQARKVAKRFIKDLQRFSIMTPIITTQYLINLSPGLSWPLLSGNGTTCIRKPHVKEDGSEPITQYWCLYKEGWSQPAYYSMSSKKLSSFRGGWGRWPRKAGNNEVLNSVLR